MVILDFQSTLLTKPSRTYYFLNLAVNLTNGTINGIINPSARFHMRQQLLCILNLAKY